ncbi:MAG TPA: BON domain-containing protein [Longimicrobium sp.]|nr:BON domain-containing protein [Longimicrobium sp.]
MSSFDPYDFTTMDDDEIYDVVLQHLSEYPELDMGWIDVIVKDGRVTLQGRVSSDGEAQIAAQAVLDVLGIADFSNELVVDELHRGEMPEAADDAVTADLEVDDQLGEQKEVNQSDTAAHLVEDLESLSYGTHDAGTAVEEGASYQPPDRPVPDGYGSRENH